MNAGQERSPQAGAACDRCLRRSWLLSELSGPLDYCARDRARLLELLALADEELMDAVAGRRRTELRDRYERFTLDGAGLRDGDAQAICRHARGYPRALDGAGAPHMLEVAGGSSRLVELTARPVVAILGSGSASDYGMEMARGLARGLAASGVTVVATLTDGVAVAAHAGAVDAAAGASIAVLGGGLGVSCPARRRALYGRVRRAGCAVSELPHGASGRRWGSLAAERIVVELAALTVVIEAEQTVGQLAGARIAQALGRPLAAIPGRVTSPLSRGPHVLLMEGASLVRGPEDVLELLYPPQASKRAPSLAPARQGADRPRGLRAELRSILELVGSGHDTPDKLTRAGIDPADTLLGLSELELWGLLGRGDGGRYLLRHPSSVDG
jgi:DNA processing protein